MHSLYLKGIAIDHASIEPDSYIEAIPALHALDTLSFDSPVTFFTGENGTGKSTLLEAIAIAAGFNPEGGTKNYRFSTYDSHSDLYRSIRLLRGSVREKYGYFLRAESFYNTAAKETEYADSAHPSGEYLLKSHGESFLALAQDVLQSKGLYILDEPEAALSPQRQLTLLLEILHSAQLGSQFLIVTHSPILLSIPEAAIYSFDEDTIHPCAYEETGCVRTTKMFIENRERVLYHLLNDNK